MKAITTTYKSVTENKDRCIVAKDTDNNKSTSVMLHEDMEENHRAAAYALCRKMNWTGTLVGGSISNDQYVWCFLNCDHCTGQLLTCGKCNKEGSLAHF